MQFSRITWRTSLLLLTLHCYTPSFAASLLQIYQDAQTNDSIYSAARAQYLASIEKMSQGRASLLPQINSQWSTNKNSSSTASALAIPNTSYSQTGWSVTLTQPLFRWERWETYQQGILAKINAETELQQAWHDLVLRTTQAYFDLLAAQDNLDLAQSKKRAIAEQLAQAKRNFELGTATIVDSHDAQARFDLAYAQEIEASSIIEIKRAVLQQITGKIPEKVAGLRSNLTLPLPEPNKIDDWIESTQQNNLEIAQAQIANENARREKNKAASGHLPNVDLNASRTYSYQAGTPSNPLQSLLYPQTNNNTRTFSNQIGIQITVPLFTGGYTQSRLRETYALLEKSRHDIESARRNTTQQTRTAFLSLTSGLIQIQALEAAEKSALSAYESNKLGYEVGMRINIDVLNSQEQLTSTRRELYKARYDVLIAGLKLKAMTNALKEEDIAWLNSLLYHSSN